MAVLEPKLAILDETDSGLDIDALKVVSNGVNKLRRPDNAQLVITHYQRLLNYIVPDFVHVLSMAASFAPGTNNSRSNSKRRAMTGSSRKRLRRRSHSCRDRLNRLHELHCYKQQWRGLFM